MISRSVISRLPAPPLMVIIMLLLSDPSVIACLALPVSLRLGGWIATVVMVLAAVGMNVSWIV